MVRNPEYVWKRSVVEDIENMGNHDHAPNPAKIEMK